MQLPVQSCLDRRVAHIGSKVRTNPPSFAKFRFFSCSLTSAPCLVITRRLCSSNKASEQIRKPSSSKESTSGPLEEEQRSRSQSVTAPSSIPGFDIGRLLARRGAGEGVADSDKLAYLKNGNRALDRSFAFPKRFLNGCQRQFKTKWLDEYRWLTYSASEDGGFCVPCALFSVVKNPVLGS